MHSNNFFTLLAIDKTLCVLSSDNSPDLTSLNWLYFWWNEKWDYPWIFIIYLFFYSSKIYYLKTLIRCDWGMDTSISMNLSPKMLEQAGMNNDFLLMLEYDETLMYGTWQLLGNKCFPAGKQALSAFAATWQYMWYEESCFLDSSVLSEFCRVVFSKQFSVWNKIKV